jgi:UDP-N-acetylmuramoyl-L-alanyl-D-glutamate--2,6-diaminopimelate ligase
MDKILYKIKKYIPIKIFKSLQPIYHFLLNWLSALIYKFPSKKLIVVGVTGTTGKTTSVYLMAKMLEAAGHKTGYTSTAMFGDGKKEWLNDKKMTMPGRFFTQKMLYDMVKNKCQYAIVETTSEGIKQFRHRFINYDILVFTGLYPEHIESHGGFLNYKECKGKLFAHLKRCKTKYSDDFKNIKTTDKGIKKIELNRIKKTIVLNGDDEHFDYFNSFWAEKKFIYTQKSDVYKKNLDMKDIEIVSYGDIKASNKGIDFRFLDKKINLKLLGEFNADNAMNAVCLGLSQDLGADKIRKGLESIKGVPGRMEMIKSKKNFIVIVDYAFEPKAVTKLYKAINSIPHNNIIHVLGSCGGGRDKSRRPILGKIAGAGAKYIIVSNEDPYDEDSDLIINAVAEGAIKAGAVLNENLFKISDRREAIKKALSLAGKEDIVLITGKGSEQAICAAGGEKIKWDDRKVVRELLLRNIKKS